MTKITGVWIYISIWGIIIMFWFCYNNGLRPCCKIRGYVGEVPEKAEPVRQETEFRRTLEFSCAWPKHYQQGGFTFLTLSAYSSHRTNHVLSICVNTLSTFPSADTQDSYTTPFTSFNESLLQQRWSHRYTYCDTSFLVFRRQLVMILDKSLYYTYDGRFIQQKFTQIYDFSSFRGSQTWQWAQILLNVMSIKEISA